MNTQQTATRALTRLSLAIAITLPVGLAGCDRAEQVHAPPAGTPEALDFALESRVNDTIVPSIEAFADSAQALDQASEAFCEHPVTDTLEDARSAWNEASARWNRAVIYNFGPLNDDIFAPKIHSIESMRQRGIDYSAKVRHEIERQLAADGTLDTAHFDALRHDQTGLLPVEILLFESTADGHPQAAEAVVEDFHDHPRKCDYLLGVTERLANDAGYVEAGWTYAFKDTETPYRELFLAGELDQGGRPLAVLLVSVQDHLDYLQRRKLEGMQDARLAGRFYDNATATIEEIETLVGGEHGLLAEAEARGHTETATAIRKALDRAVRAAANEDRKALTTQVDLLWKLFRERLPDALGVELGLNFSDGD